MRRFVKALFFPLLGVIASASCGPGDPDGVIATNDEDVGTTEDALTKCQDPTANGASNFCNDPACPCTLGEGDCDQHAHCSAPYACTGNPSYFGFPAGVNVCAGSHCADKKKNGDETAVDCGGSCGTLNCPADVCAGLPANGLAGHCSVTCPCAANNGNCDSDSQCLTGLTCRSGFGALYGFSSTTRVCMATHCNNNLKDGDETGADCGGSCAPCGGATLVSQRFGSTDSDQALSVAYDSSGNIVMVGRYTGTVNFGGGNLVSAGLSDIFVVKLTSAGAHVWSKSFGSTLADGEGGLTVALDTSSNVYVAGNFSGSVNFGGGAKTAVGTSAAFLIKLSSAGAHVFSKSFGGARMNRITGLDVVGSNLIVTGSFQDSINLGGSTLTGANPPTGEAADLFVAKLNTAGAHVWSRSFGSTGYDHGAEVALDSAANVYLAGMFTGTVNFGLGNVVSAGSSDSLAMKLLGTDGSTQWVRAWGGTSDDRTNTVAVGSDNHPVFGGRYKRIANFGSGQVVSAGGTDAFVVSLDSTAGTTRWSHSFGGVLNDNVIAVSVLSASKAVAVTGYYTNSMNPGLGVLTSQGAQDIFVLRYTTLGALSWQKSLGSTGIDHALDVRYTTASVGVTGLFNGTVNFGTGAYSSAGGNDAFMATFQPGP